VVNDLKEVVNDLEEEVVDQVDYHLLDQKNALAKVVLLEENVIKSKCGKRSRNKD
jgi:hypothetical protein